MRRHPYDQWWMDNCRDLNQLELCALHLRLYSARTTPVEFEHFRDACWQHCAFAAHELALSLLYDADVVPGVRRRAAILYLAYSRTADATLPEMSVIRPLLTEPQEEAPEAVPQLQLVRVVLRKQNWWRPLRREVRSVLAALARRWLGRAIDLRHSRSAACFHLCEEILEKMRAAGAAPAPHTPRSGRPRPERERAHHEAPPLPQLSLGSTSRSAQRRRHDRYEEWWMDNFQHAELPFIAEQHLNRLVEDDIVGDEDEFYLACLWWCSATGVELARSTLYDPPAGADRSYFAAAYVVGIPLASGWEPIDVSTVSPLVTRPSDIVHSLVPQLFLIRVILCDEMWWETLRTEIRPLLEELLWIWRDFRHDLSHSSRRTCLRHCEQLISDDYDRGAALHLQMSDEWPAWNKNAWGMLQDVFPGKGGPARRLELQSILGRPAKCRTEGLGQVRTIAHLCEVPGLWERFGALTRLRLRELSFKWLDSQPDLTGRPPYHHAALALRIEGAIMNSASDTCPE